jgi:hypothetical protein
MPYENKLMCASVLGGKDRAEQRLTEALAVISDFKDYRKLLADVQAMSSEDRASCPGLAAAVTDRAFNVESRGRVLIGQALDSVNSLRDQGSFYENVARLAHQLTNNGAQEFLEQLRDEAKTANEKFGDAAADLLNEAANATEALGLHFSSQRGSLLVRRKQGPQGEDQIPIATTRQLGQAGRVSSAAFFGGQDRLGFVTFPTLYAPIDCHHRPIIVKADTVAALDAYAATVGGLAVTKGLLYQHARRTAELGPRGMRGEDPVTAILIAIAVVGAGLVVYGIATGNYGLAAFGAVLIIGAAFVAFGGYTLILAVVA